MLSRSLHSARPMRAAAGALLLAASVLSACASDPDGSASLDPHAGGKADDTSATATLSLTADFEEELAGTIVAGRPLTIRYALDRVTECRGSTGGSDAWGVTGFYSVDGDEAASFAASELRDGVTVPVEATIEVPAGAEIAFWFVSSNRWGCVAYDSDYGANYRYSIETSPSGPVEIDFAADGAWNVAGGPLAGGSDVVVRYALDRLTTCRGTSRGYPQWSITGFYAVDDDEPTPFEVSRSDGSDRVPVDATFSVRAGSSLSIWFQNTNRWGCVAWDSQDGANYVVPMSP